MLYSSGPFKKHAPSKPTGRTAAIDFRCKIRTGAIPSPEKDLVFAEYPPNQNLPIGQQCLMGLLLDTFSTLNHQFECYFDVIWEIRPQIRKKMGGSTSTKIVFCGKFDLGDGVIEGSKVGSV